MKKIKKLLSVILTIACMCSLVPVSVGAASYSASSNGSVTYGSPLTLSAGSSKIDLLSGTTLTITNNTSSYKINKASWSSSDPSVATVTAKKTTSTQATAYVEAMSGGTTTITAKVQMSDGNTYKTSKKIKVNKYSYQCSPLNQASSGENIYVNSVAVSNDYIIEFTYPANEQISWSVSDSSLASIQNVAHAAVSSSSANYGINKDTVTLRLKKAGTVKVTAKNQTGEKVASKNLKIKPYAKKVAFNDGSKLSLTKGTTKTLKYSIKNANGNVVSKAPSDVKFKASTSNSSVVKIQSSSSGKIKIKAVGKGTATIKVKAKDGGGASDTIKITVK